MHVQLSRDPCARLVCDSDHAVQRVIEVIYEAKLGDDVVYAYMAETYPLHPEAAHWRKLSGTQNGVFVAFFLNTMNRWDQWIVEVARDLPGRTLSPVQRLLIAWIQGTLPQRIRTLCPEFGQAVELRLVRGMTGTATHEDLSN